MTTITTIEQSKKLREHGLSTKTADFMYERDGADEQYEISLLYGEYIPGVFSDRNEYTVPAWSLGTLIELMPKNIKVGNVYCDRDIFVDGVTYFSLGNSEEHFNISWGKENLLENVVNAVCWLLDKKHI